MQSAKTRLGADCGSDYEVIITKLRVKLNAEPGTAKTNLEETSRGSVSDSRGPLLKVEGPRPYGCKDTWLTKS